MSHMPTTRRVITGHDDNGKAIFTSDDTLRPYDPTKSGNVAPSGKMVGFTTIHRTEGVPAKISGPVNDLHGELIPLCTSSDVTCRIVDFPPFAGDATDEVNIMHRTQSLDYGVILKGTINLILDDGAEKVMNEGDICVQRGTIHGWKNVSQENCRMLFVLIPSEPVKVESTGAILEPTDINRLIPIDQS